MKKPIKLSAYAYILLILLSFLFGVTHLFLDFNIEIGLYLINLLLIVIIYRGLKVLGNKLKSKFIVVISVLGIILGIVYNLYLLLAIRFMDLPMNQIANVILMVILGLQSILLGIAFITIRKKIKYALVAGILNIISGITLFNFLGTLMAIPAGIFEILLLFEASRRFEPQ